MQDVKRLISEVAAQNLRHSGEMTRLCSRNLTQQPAFGGDDNACYTFGLRTKTWPFPVGHSISAKVDHSS
jgi:hypothetical protein